LANLPNTISWMQFEEMSEYERFEIKKALLKYCELDTLAMVLIYEGWKDFVNLNVLIVYH
jgi:hypothetical protein